MSPDKERFSPDAVLRNLASGPIPGKFWVGLSGGADSTALLIALHSVREHLPAPLYAVHFNHGLQASADNWQDWCEKLCAERDIPLHVIRLGLDGTDSRSPETSARSARYAAVASLLDRDDCYLTAHHADDNAETMLLHLLRGSGLDGVAGIPPRRAVGKGWVARPLLDFRRKDLETYLQQRGIRWQQDATNKDVKLDRGFLRNELLPLMASRWPAAVSRLHRTAVLARETMEALGDLLEQHYGPLLDDPFVMPLAPLLELPVNLQPSLVRHWMKRQGMTPPPGRRLGEFLHQMNTTPGMHGNPASDGSSLAEVRWSTFQLKLHGDRLWLHEWPAPGPCPLLEWKAGRMLSLGPGFGEVAFGPSSARIPDGWCIGPRRSGAKMRTRSDGPRRGLKGLMRETRIPPWLRDSVPVLYWQAEPVWIGGVLTSPSLQEYLDREGTRLEWHPSLPLLQKLQSVSVQFLTRTDHADG